MADTFLNPIALPEIPTDYVVPSAPAGYIKVYAKNGKVVQKNADGIEATVTNDQKVFIETTANLPTVQSEANITQSFLQYTVNGNLVTPYIWIP